MVIADLTAPPEPEPELRGAASVCRRVTVKPAMCGHNSLFVGQIGDWTWETVSALCGTNVFRARSASGAPTYLAFYYFHLKASPAVHLRSFGFGDEIEVVSSVFGFGSESVLTLHRIGAAADGATAPAAIDPRQFYEHPDDRFLYVENFNRWVSRSREGSNEDLVKSSPVDFRHAHLPVLPDEYSPRPIYGRARTLHTFHDLRSREYRPAGEALSVDYPIDVSRDVNGVGLVYFASYFSIIDWALLRLWRHLGRSDRSFMRRVVLDQKLCYLGNAELDSVLRITLTAWRSVARPGEELFNVVIDDRASRRVIAVSTLDVLSEDLDGGVD